MRSTLPIAFAAAIAGVALFSAMDVVMKGLSIALGAYNAMLYRAGAGTVIGIACMIATRTPWPARAVLRVHAMRGVVNAFMALCFFWGIARMPIAEAIALSFIAPLIALYLAAIVLKERIGRGAVIASVLGLAGVGVILTARLGGAYDEAAAYGAGSILISAVLFAWNLILQRQQAKVAGAIEVGFFHSMVVFAVLLLAAPFLAVLPSAQYLPSIVSAAALAFVSATLLSWAYARAEAQILIPVEYTAFIWAALLGWLVFDEKLTAATLAGTALIVTGCIIAARRRPDLAGVEAEVA